jgi:hypothetical protein
LKVNGMMSFTHLAHVDSSVQKLHPGQGLPRRQREPRGSVDDSSRVDAKSAMVELARVQENETPACDYRP